VRFSTVLLYFRHCRTTYKILLMEQGTRPIPNRLSHHRRLRGYKQAEVARLLGLYGTVALRSWEKGKTMPSGANLVKLSVLYRTYPNELYVDYFREIKKVLDSAELGLFEKRYPVR